MDQWLDEHPDVEQQLQQNPALINDSNFLAQHQGLQAFLNDHPRIREEFTENPSYFMQRENQFEGTGADRDRMRTNAGVAPANPNPDLNQREVGRMDQFFDDHPLGARWPVHPTSAADSSREQQGPAGMGLP